MEKDAKKPRKPGRVPGPPTERYQVLLDSTYAEWAKAQPGGLSGTLRRLLNEEYERARGTAATSTSSSA